MPGMASPYVSSSPQVTRPELMQPDEILSLQVAFKALPRLDGSPSDQQTIASAHQMIDRLAKDIETWQSIHPSQESQYQQQIQHLAEENASQQQQIHKLIQLSEEQKEKLEELISLGEAHLDDIALYRKKCDIQEGVLAASVKKYKVLDAEKRDLEVALTVREKANADLKKQVGLLEHKNDLLQQIIDRLDGAVLSANENLKQFERRVALKQAESHPVWSEPMPIDQPSGHDRKPDETAAENTAVENAAAPHEELSSLKVKNQKLKRENGALQQEVKVLKKLLKEAKGR